MTTEGETTPGEPAFSLPEAFLRRQQVLAAELGVTAGFTSHPTTVGDATEANWVAMLRSVLPNRYGVGGLQAVDSRGDISEQIDVAIYDQQYAPLFFRSAGGVLIVPVESIYAVFEIKPEINKTLATYSGGKIASVRRLYRTSAEIHHVGGTTPGPDPATKPILGGILAARWGWTDRDSPAASAAIAGLEGDSRIDIGIALDSLAFDHTDGELSFSKPGTQLIYFALHLFRRLQPLATALAPDLEEYEKSVLPPANVRGSAETEPAG